MGKNAGCHGTAACSLLKIREWEHAAECNRRPMIPLQDRGHCLVSLLARNIYSSLLALRMPLQHYGLVVEEVLLDFEAFTIVRAISVKCEVELPPGGVQC
jgi:hypothetical protein